MSILELITAWVDLTDAIAEEEMTVAALRLGPTFESQYVEILRIDRDAIEAQLPTDMLDVARKTWRKMRLAHTIPSYSIDYDDAQRDYKTWMEALPGKVGETAPLPVVVTVEGPIEDLPF